MSAAWLQVVGIGAGGLADMSPAARRLVDEAEVLIGGRRHLAMIPDGAAERIAWQSPLAATLDAILERRGRRCVVLASGDPLWFGVGRLLGTRVAAEEIAFHPACSALQLACARLGWAMEETGVLSLHGRPLEALRRHLTAGRRLLCLTDGAESPRAIAAMLIEAGFGASRMHVLGDLGAPRESCWQGLPGDVPAIMPALNVTAIELRGGPGHATTPGLPEEAFVHDGRITKREVRAATLARLGPRPGQRLWDVGAGSGAIAIEWLRAGPAMSAVAFEAREDRLAMIRANALALGVPELEIVAGTAPACLPDGPAPDAIFIGGGLGAAGLLEACEAALAPGGRLVANAVTIRGEQALLAAHERLGGELSRLSVARAARVGPHMGWKPFMPVTQWSWTKP